MSFIVKLFQCLFIWRAVADPEEKIGRADVVLAQAFGLRQDSPGESNKALAKIIRRLYKMYNLPLILQWEIADCLPDLSVAFIVREHRIKGKYLDTYEMIAQAKIFCEERGWKKAIIIAHPDHYWRCVMTAKKLGLDALSVDTSSVPYDRFSVQSWTRSSSSFIPREIVARIYFLLTGKL